MISCSCAAKTPSNGGNRAASASGADGTVNPLTIK